MASTRQTRSQDRDVSLELDRKSVEGDVREALLPSSLTDEPDSSRNSLEQERKRTSKSSRKPKGVRKLFYALIGVTGVSFVGYWFFGPVHDFLAPEKVTSPPWYPTREHRICYKYSHSAKKNDMLTLCAS